MGVMLICVKNEDLGTWTETEVKWPTKEVDKSFLWWKWKAQEPAISTVEYCRLAVKEARALKEANPNANIKVLWDSKGWAGRHVIWYRGEWQIDTNTHDFYPDPY
jgi:hypothetical protein